MLVVVLLVSLILLLFSLLVLILLILAVLLADEGGTCFFRPKVIILGGRAVSVEARAGLDVGTVLDGIVELGGLRRVGQGLTLVTAVSLTCRFRR